MGIDLKKQETMFTKWAKVLHCQFVYIILDKSIIDKSSMKKRIEMLEINELLYQLHLVDQTVTQLFEQQLGISLTRYQILQFLVQQAPCNQIALQEKLQIDQAALTRHFKILESEGYVSRKRNPANQREILVELTAFAKDQLLVNPPKKHLRVKGQMEEILSVPEQKELTHLLAKLVAGLKTIDI